MKIFFTLIFVFFLAFTLLFAQGQEELTITTYYPSPYGSYRELRSQRVAIGDNYIKNDQYCWEGTCTNTIDANADLVVAGNVGFGTTNPYGQLEVSFSDPTLFEHGNYNLVISNTDKTDGNWEGLLFRTMGSDNGIKWAGGYGVLNDSHAPAEHNSGHINSRFFWAIGDDDNPWSVKMILSGKGYLGVGHWFRMANPQAMLDVAGEVRIGMTPTAAPDPVHPVYTPFVCNATTEGALRYNIEVSPHRMEICKGASGEWAPFGGTQWVKIPSGGTRFGDSASGYPRFYIYAVGQAYKPSNICKSAGYDNYTGACRGTASNGAYFEGSVLSNSNGQIGNITNSWGLSCIYGDMVYDAIANDTEILCTP